MIMCMHAKAIKALELAFEFHQLVSNQSLAIATVNKEKSEYSRSEICYIALLSQEK